MKGLLLATSLSLMAVCCWAVESVPRADKVLVKKSERKLYLIKDGTVYREFGIALGPRPRGHKQHAGDARTPEGSYLLDFKNPNSNFYKSIRISYPNESDLRRATELGLDPGGSIMIHGLPNGVQEDPSFVQLYNWTDGCIAVTNAEMDEIWAAVMLGTPIDIYP